jgi:hypothetical protein
MKMNQFKDVNIYAFNILKSTKIQFDQNYSYLHSALIHLEHLIDTDQIEHIDVAFELMKIVNSTDSFFNLDRVCLVFAEPLSSRLHVLSSHNSDQLAENLMPPKYSCYVSSESSLFRINKNSVRVYGDIDSVVSSYMSNKPQRSIFKLSKMGVKSGITIPLGNFGYFSGYLFLNSAKVDVFNSLKDEDYSIISMLKLIASNILYRHLHSAISVDSFVLDKIKDIKSSNRFDAQAFKQHFEQMFSERFSGHQCNIEIKQSVDTEILFNYSTLLYLVMRLFEFEDSWRSSKIVKIQLEINDTSKLNVVIMGLKIDFKRLAFFNELGVFIAESFKVENGNTVCSFAIEKSVDGLAYSVEHDR